MSVAAFGLILGHSLTYYWLEPERASHIEMLEHTGHGYLDSVVSVAGPLAFMSLLFLILLGAHRGRHDVPPSLAGCVSLMATVQVVGFGLQEVMERMITGGSLSDLPTVLTVGLLVQLAVAAIGALLVFGLHRAGQLISRLIKRKTIARPSSSTLQHVVCLPFRSAIAFGGLRMRGPPALL
jgi:hypothetical protein